MVNYHKRWRLINSASGSASHNMALDEAIAFFVRKGNSIPTLRLYSWKGPSLSLGCFQKKRDIDIEYCASAGIPVVRRPTGGRAILHGKELTYSFSINTKDNEFSKGIFDSYKKISRALGLALSKTGLTPETRLQRENRHTASSPLSLCFQSASYGEIMINNRKIVGSAQKRWSDGLLQQGSIPYIVDESLLRKVFSLRPGYDIKSATAGLMEAVPGLRDEEFRENIRLSFEEIFGIEFIPGFPSEEEASLALRLQREKYQAPEWTLRQ